MRSLFRSVPIFLIHLAFVSSAPAQAAPREVASGAPTEVSHPVLTGKERLGPKWTDEQRIDNCRVPIDKRGSKPRPGTCANHPAS